MQRMLQKMLDEIDVTINGKKPYDIKVHDKRMYTKLFKDKSIGAGDAYVEGMWDCEKLDELFFRICRNKLYNKIYSPFSETLYSLKNSVINQQTREKSEEVAKRHYNLGNPLFEKMLGKSMAYTCGYWKNADNLDEAQFAKYDLVCKKLQLQPGETVLELGCGWGGLAKYMAEKYDCKVVGFDIGKEPARYAKDLCRHLPVKIYHCDYRDISIYNPNREKFDKLVSVGVLEHIGYKNYDQFLSISRSFIKDDGLFLLHSIGSNYSKNYCEPWINKNIFPNGMLPSLKWLGKAIEKKFIVEDFHNFGAFYDRTLLAWHENLNKHWKELSKDYDTKLLRMMNYYLLSCAGGFRARDMQLWQFLLSPKGIIGGYNRIV